MATSMIASLLGFLIGLWDGFAGVFYDHRHPMGRSYALGHAIGRQVGAIPLWRTPAHPLQAGVADERHDTPSAAGERPPLTHSVP